MHACLCIQVESIAPDTSAIEAMAIMSDKHISSLGIVDAVGKLIGTFSVSDMRCGLITCGCNFDLRCWGMGVALGHGEEANVDLLGLRYKMWSRC